MFIISCNSLLAGQAAVSQRNDHMLTWLSKTGGGASPSCLVTCLASIAQKLPRWRYTSPLSRRSNSTWDPWHTELSAFRKIMSQPILLQDAALPFTWLTLWLSSFFLSSPHPDLHRYQSTVQDSGLFFWPTLLSQFMTSSAAPGLFLQGAESGLLDQSLFLQKQYNWYVYLTRGNASQVLFPQNFQQEYYIICLKWSNAVIPSTAEIIQEELNRSCLSIFFLMQKHSGIRSLNCQQKLINL